MTKPCRYACAAFPHCGCEVEAIDAPPCACDAIGRTFVALHPYMFRHGQAAYIAGITKVRGRLCFHLRYEDGVEDCTPIENEDFVGEGGEGVFYTIT